MKNNKYAIIGLTILAIVIWGNFAFTVNNVQKQSNDAKDVMSKKQAPKAAQKKLPAFSGNYPSPFDTSFKPVEKAVSASKINNLSVLDNTFDIKLSGIINSKALLFYKGKNYCLAKNDTLAGYKISKIQKNSITMLKNNKTKTLTMLNLKN